MTPALHTQLLTRRFGDRIAVDQVSMTVPAGSIYGFLGRNGAGKTTTLKLLLGLLRADAGQAFVDGIDVAADRIGAARRVSWLTCSDIRSLVAASQPSSACRISCR